MPYIQHSDRTVSRGAARVALGALAVLLALALVFWRQRMLFADAAYIAFERVNLRFFESSQRRYGAVFTESVPWLLARLHVPLHHILIAYSACFNLLYLATGAWLYRNRQYALTVLLTLYYTLMVSDGFFWTNNEIHQAVAFLFLCAGVATRLARAHKPFALQLVCFTGLAALTLSTHPLVIVCFPMIWWLLWLDGAFPASFRNKYLILCGVLAALVAVKLWMSLHQDYDSRKMRDVLAPGHDRLRGLLTNGMVRTYALDCLRDYWWAPVLWAAGNYSMLRQKRLWAALCCNGAALGYLVIMSLNYGGVGVYDVHYRYYMEGEWQIMTLMLAAPFVLYTLPGLGRRAQVSLLSLVLLTRFAYILGAAPAFTARMHYLESLLDGMRRHGYTKVILAGSAQGPEADLFADWSLPMETMMLSALQGEYPQRTAVVLWPDQQDRVPKSRSEMVWKNENHPSSDLNPRYFAMDTATLYVPLDKAPD